MLLHTVDWWPVEPNSSGRERRERLADLFPVAMLGSTARRLVAEGEWALCRQLYDYVVRSAIHGGLLPPDAVLGLAAANARLAAHLWPVPVRPVLSASLTAATERAMGKRIARRVLDEFRGEVLGCAAALPAGTAAHTTALTVVTVLRAGAQPRSDSAIARTPGRVLGSVESAALQAGEARAEVWRPAFLLLELAVSGSPVRSHV